MLEYAASPAYKDLFDALGKLAEWADNSGSGHVPSGPPPSDLVRQFTEVLEQSPQASEALSVQRSEQISASAQCAPHDLIASSDLFQSGEISVENAEAEDFSDMSLSDRLSDQPRRPAERLTTSQEVNLERGMQAIDEVSRAKETDFLRSAERLSEILSRSASELSPVDLLQAQRLIGVMRIHAESGQKLSEGVGETLEQLLEQQA